VNCGRLSAQAKLLLKVGSIGVLPPCKDLRDASIVPKVTIAPKQK